MTNLDRLTYRIADVKVHALQPEKARDIVLSWFDQPRRFHYISSTNMNHFVNIDENKEFDRIVNHADLSLPDGMPLIWYGRLLGYQLPKRCGIEELMMEIFDLSNQGYSFTHYFFGNTPKVLKYLKKKLLKQFPHLKIAGMCSPPFRELTEEENHEYVQQINRTDPDFIWVSLGCPKQEIWLYKNRKKLNAVVGGGAGAVFNFLSGQTPKAPDFLRYWGLEWFFRLINNPKLAPRYLYKYPKFFLKRLSRKITLLTRSGYLR
ncbi:MAG: WecB/TagA/CpsF family glycosyltransferase [Candidatus Aminicenantes bacterium]|nr:WecB/TagA/CpsF family glycosyltransferase [Candidatus Aminicenantes bacterium]